MAINNYTWTGNGWFDLGADQQTQIGSQALGRRSSSVATEVGGQTQPLPNGENPAILGTTGFNRLSGVLTNPNFGANLHGRFTWCMAPDFIGDWAHPVDNSAITGQLRVPAPSEFEFYRVENTQQRFIFAVSGSGDFGTGVTAQLRGGDDGTQVLMVKDSADWPVTVVSGAPGACVQIEWLTNLGDNTRLSADPALPELPTFTFTMRASQNSASPEDVATMACFTIDTTILAALSPGSGFHWVDAMQFFGGGFKSALDQFNFGLTQPTFTPFPIGVPGFSPIGGFPTGVTIIQIQAREFQKAYEFHGATAGYVPIGDGVTNSLLMGLLDPDGQEVIRPGIGITGWQMDLVGTSELILEIIDEPWEFANPVNPNEIIDEAWPDPSSLLTPVVILEETWEFTVVLTPSTILEETWES